MIYGNYIHTKKINLDLDIIKKSSIDLYNLVIREFGDGKQYYEGQSTISTKLFSNYNALMYTYNGLHELYEEIKKYFREINPDDEKYYIQSWINVYQKGDYIDWHRHWEPKFNSWHGFYCVSVPEKSGTTYKIPNYEETFFVPSEENLLVISPSQGDLHKSSENLNYDPRITIAFDIVPRQFIDNDILLNHWIPI